MLDTHLVRTGHIYIYTYVYIYIIFVQFSLNAGPILLLCDDFFFVNCIF